MSELLKEILPSRPTFLRERNIPIWILITGNLRSGREFRKSIAQAIDLRTRGLVDAIRLVTWTGELQQAPGLENALVSAGISILTVDPPPPDPRIHPLFHSYTLYQRKQLHFGLQSLPPGVFVLKSRTDFSEQRFAAMTSALFTIDGADIATRIPSPILQSRIFTFDSRPDFLFYWDDIVFSGIREDLQKINNFDISFSLTHQDTKSCTEVRLFSPLFLNHYPLLQWFFENVDGRKFANLLHAWAASPTHVPLPCLAKEILASYLHILKNYLLLPTPEHRPAAPSSTSSLPATITLKSFISPNPDLGVSSFSHPWPSHKLIDASLLDWLAADRPSHDPILHDILTRIRQMDDDPQSRGTVPSAFTPSIDDFTRFAQSFNISLLKPQSVLIPAQSASPAQSSADFLENIPMPEKRHLPRWKQKSNALRKHLASYLLRKCL